MARLHSHRKGKSKSTKPLRTKAPDWVPLDKREIEELVVKLAKEGQTTATIGASLRDQYAVPDVRLTTGRRISEILKASGGAPKIPEDLAALIKRAILVNEHMQEHSHDYHNKRALQLIESKIRRLAKYYSREGVLPGGWNYSMDTARLLVE